MKRIKNYLESAPKIKIISDVSFVLALLISAITIVRTYLIRQSLPPGVCPIESQNGWYYLSIGLLVVSFIISLFDKKKST